MLKKLNIINIIYLPVCVCVLDVTAPLVGVVTDIMCNRVVVAVMRAALGMRAYSFYTIRPVL